MPHLVEGFGHVEGDSSDFTLLVQSVGPALGHVQQKIQGSVLGSEAKLTGVELV